jgi:glycosyltransferase involved in cell wall biosynthesis
MADLVHEQIREHSFDAAIALTTAAGEYLTSCSIPNILDDDNVDTAYIQRLVELANGKLLKFRRKLTWVKLARHEGWLVENFTATTVVSDEDRHELARLVPQAERRGAIHVVPNGVDLQLTTYEAPAFDPKSIISTGALTYNANLDGAIYFCEQILPKIRAEVPDTNFMVTGGYDGVDIPQVVSTGATLTGFLEDIRPKLAGSAALVVPLRIGGGTRLKILEAMALGAPVVSTSLGAAGLGVTHEETALVADDPEEFAECVLRLMRDSELRAKISRNGREYVVSKFGWQRSVEALDRIVHSIAGQGKYR